MRRASDIGGGAATTRLGTSWHGEAGGKRRLAILAMLLFLLSLLVQYASFVAVSPVAAVHDEGIFELDGNALDQGGVDGDDWEDGTPGAADDLFIPGSVEAEGPDATYFHGGGSKDENVLSQWGWSATDVAPDKDELVDVFAAVYEDGDTRVYFGADKFDDSGDAQIGFWFFQDAVSLDNDGSFNGTHTVGDLLILSDFTNGGVVDLICVFEWNPPGDGDLNGTDCDESDDDNLDLVAAGAECDVSSPDGAFDVCAVVNAAIEDAPWPFENKDDETDFNVGQFFEGGINLSQLFGVDAPCFSTFLAETRSSQETDAQLKDFALGSLDTCVPPELETDSSVSEADFGDDVTDTATLSGSQGPVEGTITFFICEPDEVTSGGCEGSAGTQVGSPVTIVNDEAESAAYTVGLTEDAVGRYCWRAEYTPSEDSEYLATMHTDADRECFQVAPATIDVEKTADAASVNAGEQIGFTVTISNTGDNTALGVSFTDSLPGGDGIDWSIESQSGGFSITGTAPNQSLVFAPTTLAAGASAWVHIVSGTTGDSCGIYDNTAAVTTTNDGSDEDSATTEVLCAEIDVEKTADAATVNAGDQIGFTVTISNTGDGLATGLAFTDNLPGGNGVIWTIESSDAGWSITGSAPNQQLVYAPTTLAAGASTSVHVVSATTAASCKVYDNTAAVTTGNDGSDEDSATTEVLCGEINVEKVADDATVNAGEQIGFTVTLTNSGDGLVTGLAFTDALPGGDGVSWSIESQSGGFSITGTAPNQSLVFAPTTLAAGESAWVHVVSATTGDSCGQYDNTASVTTTNDGSDDASDSTFVECPVLAIDKSVAESGFDAAGQVLHYTIVVTNVGNVTLHDVVVTDALVSDLDCEPDLPVPTLEVGDGFTCTATYTVVEADFDTLLVTNVACADDGNGDGDTGANPVCDDVSTPGQELEEETDAPTQPPTDGVAGGSNTAPSDGAWLLVIGLAILLSTVVLMTPARRRSRN